MNKRFQQLHEKVTAYVLSIEQADSLNSISTRILNIVCMGCLGPTWHRVGAAGSSIRPLISRTPPRLPDATSAQDTFRISPWRKIWLDFALANCSI